MSIKELASLELIKHLTVPLLKQDSSSPTAMSAPLA